MAAISYEQICVEGPWELQSVYELSIHSGLNRHTIARFTALVTEKSGAEAGLKETVDDRVKIYIDDNGKKTMLFQGRIKEVDIRLRTGVYLLSAGLISETSLLDREIKSRSFQNTELTYDQVVGKVLQDYPGKSLELTAAKVKLTGPVIQYLETDWQFILRMASLQETVIAADGTAIQRIFAYGYPSGQEKTLPDEISYSFTKDIRAYERDAEYNPHCNSAEYAYYEVESYDPLTIGDPVTFQGYPMYVGEVTVQLQQGLLVYMAKLVRKATLRQNPIYNKAFQGTSLIGKVLQLQDQSIKIHLHIDKEQNREEAYWYPFVPPTTDMMYLMPQLGTDVSLYIPRIREQDAIITGCVRTNGATCRKTGDPNTRYLGTEYGQELKMAPGGIYITAGNTQLITTFDDQNGVTLSSPKGIDIGAKQGITLSTEKQVVISANSKIMLGTPNEEFPFSGLVLENEIQAVAPMMLMQCSESTSYGNLKQPPPPKKWYQKINWTAAIVGTVVGVAVAAVCVAAAPEAILAAGAALVAGSGEAAAVFGGIGSVLGTSAEAVAGAAVVDALSGAVASLATMATEDAQKGKARSPEKYVDGILEGGVAAVFTGAVLRITGAGIKSVWESGLLQSEAGSVNLDKLTGGLGKVFGESGEVVGEVDNSDSLYKRSSFRKTARAKAESEAPKNASGKMICPTCGKEISDSITMNTKNGPVERIGYDLDHYPDTWAERVTRMKSGEVKPTRAEVLNEYNARLRVQCHACNISHAFEGVEGTYKGD
jgi:hypothetical protein